MRDNTPPRISEIEDDEFLEYNANAADEDDEDLLEMEEVTLEELEARLNDEIDSEEEGDDEQLRSRTPVEDMSSSTFKEHTSAVFACAMHPLRNEIVATGGEDDKAFVWHRETGQVLYTIDAHKDTITEVHFSHDGTYLATGDMAGEVIVHKLQAASENADDSTFSFRKIWEYSMGDMAWLFWHNAGNVLLAGSESGEIYIWRIPSGDCKILAGVGERCEAGSLTGDGKKLFAAYANGVLKLWDLKNCTCVMEVDQQHPMGHQESTVMAVACEKDNPIYMSGGADKKILFCSNNGPVGVLEADGPVECVSFSPNSDLKLAASGCLTGQIAIWDYAKYTMRTLCENPLADDGITKLKWLDDHTILVATIQGFLHAFDVRSGQLKFKLTGHTGEIYDFCFNKRTGVLLTVSEDQTAKCFQIPELAN